MGQILLPNQLTNGSVADATQVMANFKAIVDVVNGNLDSSNLNAFGGDDVTCIDLNGGSSTLNTFTQRFQAGFIEVPAGQGKGVQSQTVKFPVTYDDIPLVICTLLDNRPDEWAVSANNITTSQFDFIVANLTTSTRIGSFGMWLAVFTGAGSPGSGG